MADFVFKISPNIVLGSYTATRLGQHSSDWGKKFMVILDPILKESGTSAKITQSLDEHGIEYFIFDEIDKGCNTEVLNAALSLARTARVHGIIAAGGGKTLSLAKALSSYYNETADLYSFIDGSIPDSKPLPLICLPTTIRDAFIFTDRVPVTDARSNQLRILKTQNGVCRLLLWDPNLQVALTQKQTSVMALESLTFAIEGYLSQRTTFFSDMLLEKSVQLLNFGMEGSDSLNVTTPQEVLLTEGGCMASLGMASSSAGIATLMGYAVNSRYNISRALVSSILLPYIIEESSSYKANRLAALSRIMKTCSAEADDTEAVQGLVEYVRQKIAQINIPSRLKDLSLSIEQLSLAAEDVGSLDLMQSLPRSMTTDDLFEIIKKAY